MAFTKDTSSVHTDTLSLWRVELCRPWLPHETNITVGEVVARDQAEAEEIVLNKPHLCGLTPKDIGAQVKKSTLIEVIQSGSLFRWRSSTGGVKTS